ncbi:MAG: hypothetical protein WAT74_02525 [Flavobacteriales bacterium]
MSHLLSECSESPPYVVNGKSHLWYLQKYFAETGARTIVVESAYVDRDYLEDYAAYYVRSFYPYKRYCSRLHFFRSEFDESRFQSELLGCDNPLVKEEEYLGYIVVKPLPRTIIGRTCLRTYDETNERRFPVVRRYEISLFGLSLGINAIAYQEQDSTVAACASTAIWSAFQRSGALFHHTIPSPVEITRAATKHFPFANRHFPNKGLSPEQMAHAIRSVGLEPLLASYKSPAQLKSLVYSFLQAEIPVALGFMLYANDHPPRPVGRHAACVLGYRIDTPATSPYPGEPNFFLKSSRVSGFYVHDDQVGPYARMNFESGFGNGLAVLSTSFGQVSGEPESHLALPEVAIIPLNHKIRIGHDLVLDLIIRLNTIVHDIDSFVLQGEIGAIEWNLELGYSNVIKSEIAAAVELEAPVRVQLLTKSMPKYLWHAKASGKGRSISFLFDATDIDQGSLLVGIIPSSEDLIGLLQIALLPETIANIEDFQLRKVLQEITDYLRPSAEEFHIV